MKLRRDLGGLGGWLAGEDEFVNEGGLQSGAAMGEGEREWVREIEINWLFLFINYNYFYSIY